VRRNLLLILGLALASAALSCASSARAATFSRGSIAPEFGIDALTRSLARERVGRDVFSNPYASVTISNVDLYDRFPYVEARHFQVVSDPRWNRLVYGEMGRSLGAFDGKATALGALSNPRGMAVDEQNRVFVADAGNDRIVVLRASTEFDHLDLEPQFAITGLSDPRDVAYSDGGTPFQYGDDYLYVADTGRNRVVAFAVSGSGARMVSTLGELGSGVGRFAGPMAITAGRADGVNTRDVYVADSHNRRIVHLRHSASGLEWVDDARDDADVVTSLDTDRWGNVYAAAPQQGVVCKFNSKLEPVATLRGEIARPKSFRVPFFNVHDHRDGSVQRLGQPNAISVADWSDRSGVGMWNLGVAIDGLGVVDGDPATVRFTLTDRASVQLEISDASNGRVVSRRAIGPLAAGVNQIPLASTDLAGAGSSSDLVLRVAATSSYSDGASDMAQVSFHLGGGGRVLPPSQPSLLGNWPNPTRTFTRISFLLPQASQGHVSLGVFDASGRRVRTFEHGFSPGLNEVSWDGTDDSGHPVRSGLYFYRLEVGESKFTRSVALVR